MWYVEHKTKVSNAGGGWFENEKTGEFSKTVAGLQDRCLNRVVKSVRCPYTGMNPCWWEPIPAENKPSGGCTDWDPKSALVLAQQVCPWQFLQPVWPLTLESNRLWMTKKTHDDIKYIQNDTIKQWHTQTMVKQKQNYQKGDTTTTSRQTMATNKNHLQKYYKNMTASFVAFLCFFQSRGPI